MSEGTIVPVVEATLNTMVGGALMFDPSPGKTAMIEIALGEDPVV